MAISVVTSAMSKAALAAGDEMSLLLGVRKEICFKMTKISDKLNLTPSQFCSNSTMWIPSAYFHVVMPHKEVIAYQEEVLACRFIKDELKLIEAFLKAAETVKKKDMILKAWVQQVRDLSYDIEDCLDEFVVHVGSKGPLKRLMKLKDRHRIAEQIQNLKSRVQEVRNRNEHYNLIRNELPSTSDDMDFLLEDIRNLSGMNIDEADLVGFATTKKKLLRLLDVHANNGQAQVICVVGMGGLGKTTLVRKTYETKEDTGKNFPCRAWITVSQSFDRFELLKKIISAFFGEQELKNLEGKGIQEHASYLTNNLKEMRYLIVLDDLWTMDAWTWINHTAFPSDNTKGSRVIITTRDVGLAKQCTSESLIYRLEPLKIDDAIELLLRKTNKEHKDMQKHEDLWETVTRIVKKCGCLPLAILTIGGILASKDITEWENFYKELPSELESNRNLQALKKMVTLSYNHLPSHLKPCFLYLSIFPEDFEIQRRRLVDRWISEGLVRPITGKTIDSVGKGYFKELLNRSMILPSRLSMTGSVMSCQVHDIVREIIVSVSREENFANLINSDGSTATDGNFRHVAYSGSKYPKLGTGWSHIRSLTFFIEAPMDLTKLVHSSQLRMLRVLDLKGIYLAITQNHMNSIMLLCHLKYLNVDTYFSPQIHYLPSSIGKMQGLEIIEVGYSYITSLPTEITKLQCLRSIRCGSRWPRGFDFDGDIPKYCFPAMLCEAMQIACSGVRSNYAYIIPQLHFDCSSCGAGGVRVPKGIGNLKELQVLDSVDIRRTSVKAIKELGELTHLRKLEVATEGAAKKKRSTLNASIQKLTSLRSLTVNSCVHKDSGGLHWLVSSSSPPPDLRSLMLTGYIGDMTDWFRNLTKLVKIHLRFSQLKEDKSMDILGALPKLMQLQLFSRSYVSETLVFRNGRFLQLRKLQIEEPGQLKEWKVEEGVFLPFKESIGLLNEIRFEEGALPQVESIYIGSCSLASGIIGIQHLPRLKEIKLYKCEVARLDILQEEVNAHPNRPVLNVHRNPVSDQLEVEDVEGSVVQVEAATTSRPDQAGGISQVITLPTSDRSVPLHGCSSLFASAQVKLTIVSFFFFSETQAVSS
ncbi:hypothetical protein EJB05_54341, partial [Eragrostis curvula]